MRRTFDGLVSEAEAAPAVGWDFGWLAGRATEQRPSWGYHRLLGQRLSRIFSALDLQTGGGEVLAGTTTTFPATMAATEWWPANVETATRLLGDLGCVVVVHADGSPLPFGNNAFDLVTTRHPVTVEWEEIARVLRPGGTHLAQQPAARSLLLPSRAVTARPGRGRDRRPRRRRGRGPRRYRPAGINGRP